MDTDIKAALYMLGCGLIGILLAAIEYILYMQGTIIDEFVTGTITLPEIMAMTIIIWLIIGAVLAVTAT